MPKIDTQEKLRAIYGAPMDIAVAKCLRSLDAHCKRFIELAPFAVISSAGPNGDADVSPRGDGPGFIKVLDDRTIVMPDRPGNNRVDTLSNIVDNPKVGMLFFVPGVNETLRINGIAEISTDPELMGLFADTPKAPVTAIKIKVEEAFLHCAKALMRSKLWEPETRIERKTLPTLGKMIKDQTSSDIPESTQEEADRYFANSIAERG
ncbi:pyridoxamine 5'-phosphate oxidase family protein [Thalassospira sp. HF15]|uniref:pyridoxamine 5'-phosphate oxidase family protein n=1 Tax=Thalassospira sp. HF15 TaxID=2722755 RepID=UPI00142FD7C9|nr:pyridoxamine 5'-phosphate oxidase family protein [Thalassospira sp. HF15]NIY77385.1 pyridoxamine 5'-phosphate oxidase family protein [Thalassospira sp. HF15]